MPERSKVTGSAAVGDIEYRFAIAKDNIQTKCGKLLGADGYSGINLELGDVCEGDAGEVYIAIDDQAVSAWPTVNTFTRDNFAYRLAVEIAKGNYAGKVDTGTARVGDVGLIILIRSRLANNDDDVVTRSSIDGIDTSTRAHDVVR